jgi:hypothetical protein
MIKILLFFLMKRIFKASASGFQIYNLNMNRNGLLDVHSLTRNAYHDVSRTLAPDTIFRIRVDGTCCWRIFASKYHRGEAFKLAAAYDGPPPTSWNPQSISKTPC